MNKQLHVHPEYLIKLLRVHQSIREQTVRRTFRVLEKVLRVHPGYLNKQLRVRQSYLNI